MRKLILAALLGFILGSLTSPGSVYAQVTRRLYGTLSTGAPIALKAASDGSLHVTVK